MTRTRDRVISFSHTFTSDFDNPVSPSPPPSGFCPFLRSNFGLEDYWWIIPFLQLGFCFLLFVLQRLCNLLPLLSFITISSIITFYLNSSLWIWFLFTISSLTPSYCLRFFPTA